MTLKAFGKRVSTPGSYVPFAEGGFRTPSGKCEFYSAGRGKLGHDPLPGYVPPHEDPQTRPELASKYPLQMISPPASSSLNSTFVNMPRQRKAEGRPTLHMHPADAASRGLEAGMTVCVHNERGRLSAALQISTDIREGTAALPGKWWHGESGNLLTSALYAPGGQPAFNDTFVDVSRG